MTIILQVTESKPPFKTEQAAAELRVLGGWTWTLIMQSSRANMNIRC